MWFNLIKIVFVYSYAFLCLLLAHKHPSLTNIFEYLHNSVISVSKLKDYSSFLFLLSGPSRMSYVCYNRVHCLCAESFFLIICSSHFIFLMYIFDHVLVLSEVICGLSLHKKTIQYSQSRLFRVFTFWSHSSILTFSWTSCASVISDRLPTIFKLHIDLALCKRDPVKLWLNQYKCLILCHRITQIQMEELIWSDRYIPRGGHLGIQHSVCYLKHFAPFRVINGNTVSCLHFQKHERRSEEEHTLCFGNTFWNLHATCHWPELSSSY